MKMTRRVLNALFALVLAAPALATPVVTISPSGSGTSTVTLISAGVWDVTLNTTYTAAPITFTTTCASTDHLRFVTVNAATPQTVFLVMLGPSSGTPFASVDSIDVGSSTASVFVSELRTSGNVGSVTVHAISAADIGGDIT
jgi:hypothetical protein